ncbi:hypothetical protein [Bradyrhizobium sp. RT5a]|uniref:hypothetical protein n=1 Tax=Bradyrhizobium sp. RT5a TaxID=3156380 RepID=UPI00339B076E
MAVTAPLRQIVRRLDAGSRAASMESVYQGIFERDLALIGLAETRFYPVGSAANYGLLYILLRAALDFPIGEVLELGAGQTSQLFNHLAKVGVLKAVVRTVEHDELWANRVSSAVSHEVINTRLVPKRFQGKRFNGYDFSTVSRASVELLVIDGPPAGDVSNRFDRLGATELVEWINPSRFIIIIDDAEREGEMLLVASIQSKLRDKKISYKSCWVVSNKTQVIIAGGEYVAAGYY